MHKMLLFLAIVLCGGVWAADAPANVPAPLPATRVNAKDGAEMVLIPAGAFLMGTSEAELVTWLQAHPNDKREYFADEMPQHAVNLGAFYMYKNDVTVAEYRKFCTATGKHMPETLGWGWQDNHPMVNVSWDDAKAYADWTGAVLPTEAQWEKAARGGEHHLYVWGDTWPPVKGAGNFADETLKASSKIPLIIMNGYTDGFVYTSPVGSFTANSYGLFDMVGNVAQWCTDWYGEDYYHNSPANEPTGAATGHSHVMRGGSWNDYDPTGLRVAKRSALYFRPSRPRNNIGFRCVVCLPGKPSDPHLRGRHAIRGDKFQPKDPIPEIPS